jgi:hypothetical protein
MLALKAQTELAEAVAQMTRFCMLAAVRTWTRPALLGLSLWSDLLLPPSVSRPEGSSALPGAYASYRSGGGHAAAQVIVAGEGELTGPTTRKG